VLGGSGAEARNPELIEDIAPRPLLLLSTGRGTEARANEEIRPPRRPHDRAVEPPDAPRAAALRTDRSGYERHVIGFLDRALG
jgi:hypothetical protein